MQFSKFRIIDCILLGEYSRFKPQRLTLLFLYQVPTLSLMAGVPKPHPENVLLDFNFDEH